MTKFVIISENHFINFCKRKVDWLLRTHKDITDPDAMLTLAGREIFNEHLYDFKFHHMSERLIQLLETVIFPQAHKRIKEEFPLYECEDIDDEGEEWKKKSV